MRHLYPGFVVALLAFITGMLVNGVWITAHQSSVSIARDATAPVVAASPPKQSRETGKAPIAETVAELSQIRTDGLDDDIPRAAKPLLTKLKHQLRDLIGDTINKDTHPSSPQELKESIIASLAREGITFPEPEEVIEEVVIDKNYVDPGYAYGSIYRIDVQRPAGHPDLLAITTSIGVCCGEDTSLYIFKAHGLRWDLILAQEANDYDDVSGAQGRFQYAISPTDSAGGFFVVVANVNPWCTSNWQSLRYRVLREGETAYQPRVILEKKNTIFLRGETSYELQVTSNTFRLSFFDERLFRMDDAGEDLGPHDVNAKHIVKYRIHGAQAIPISK